MNFYEKLYFCVIVKYETIGIVFAIIYNEKSREIFRRKLTLTLKFDYYEKANFTIKIKKRESIRFE